MSSVQLEVKHDLIKFNFIIYPSQVNIPKLTIKKIENVKALHVNCNQNQLYTKLNAHDLIYNPHFCFLT